MCFSPRYFSDDLVADGIGPCPVPERDGGSLAEIPTYPEAVKQARLRGAEALCNHLDLPFWV